MSFCKSDALNVEGKKFYNLIERYTQNIHN